MSDDAIELVWIDRRELVCLRNDADPAQIDSLRARLIEALADGQLVPVLGIPARVLARDPDRPWRFTIEDARTDPGAEAAA